MGVEVHMTTLQVWGLKGWIAMVAGVALAGCATTANQTTTSQRPIEDIRADAAVSAQEAQPLVAGPIRLLHANFDARAELRFSRVWRRNATMDCQGGAPLAWTGEHAVEIEKDELICVAAATPTHISWHGRPLERSATPASAQASLR
jgi:hypothetical protein